MAIPSLYALHAHIQNAHRISVTKVLPTMVLYVNIPQTYVETIPYGTNRHKHVC